MKLTREVFGTTARGEQVDRYVMETESGISASFLTLGAIWETMKVPGKDGSVDDVILGFDHLSEYEENIPHFGAPIGRNANRIAEGCFSLGGKKYQLEKNAQGIHNIHSGGDAYHRRVWEVKEACKKRTQAFVTFHLDSPHGDQGFPGNLSMDITYTLRENGNLEIHYYGVPDQDTVINFTNHCYFNLAGQQRPELAMKQLVQINADEFTPADDLGIPVGSISPVENTPMDFRVMKPIDRDIAEEFTPLKQGNGYDHNWMIRKSRAKLKLAAICKDQRSGRIMEVYTDRPGIQFYTFNMTKEREESLPLGKGGTRYTFRSACCFETQLVPNAINMPQFDSPVVGAGEAYDSTTIYKFKTE